MKRVHIYCLGHAGGSSAFFDSLRPHLPLEIELYSFDYPGHGKRAKEPLLDSWDYILQDMAQQINQCIISEVPFALFGYSMGSIVAYELIKRKLLHSDPIAMFAASHEVPDGEWKSKQYYLLDDDAFVEKMAEFGDIDARLLANKRFLQIFLRPLKNDYYLIGTYQCSNPVPVPCPLYFFYAPDDMSIIEAKEWERFSKEIQLYAVGEGHFFLRNSSVYVAERICDLFESLLGGCYEEV